MRIYLETERLTLRQFTAADADHVLAIDGDPEVMRLINGGVPIERQAILETVLPRFLAWHDRFTDFGYWAAIRRRDGEFVGWFHLRPPADQPDSAELGYRLRRSAWGQGLATEGASALVRHGFVDLELRRIVATTLAENVASARVLVKAGLRLTRTFAYDGPDPTAWHVGRAAVEYALTREEYLAARASQSGPR